MSEEAGSDGEFDRLSEVGDDVGRGSDWEVGLPSDEDLTPLSQALVAPVLASAFRVKPEPARTPLDVDRASRYTIANLRGAVPFAPYESESAAFEADVPAEEGASSGRTLRLGPVPEETVISGPQPNDSCDDASGRNPKRPRLAWTPQLHKRFVDVVAYLGIKNAVPKTIMQLMNVEGLTRENVASHLQKYRLYLKRIQGIPDEAPSPSEHQLFASVQPATMSLQQKHMLPPVPYPLPGMISMPIFGMPPPPCCSGCPIGMMPLPSLNCAGEGPCPSAVSSSIPI